MKWSFGIAVPYLRLESRYNIKGNILLLPVVGSGESTVHLSKHNPQIPTTHVNKKPNPNFPGDCKCYVTCAIAMEQIDEREIIQVSRMDVDFSVAGMRLHLGNLFNGNKVLGTELRNFTQFFIYFLFLGQTVNQFLNKNALQVVDELKEDIGKALSHVFVDILNNAFRHLPTDLWLPPE